MCCSGASGGSLWHAFLICFFLYCNDDDRCIGDVLLFCGYCLAISSAVTPGPKLEPNAGSDRSWVWTCPAGMKNFVVFKGYIKIIFNQLNFLRFFVKKDLADGAPVMELFAIRFANSEGNWR